MYFLDIDFIIDDEFNEQADLFFILIKNMNLKFIMNNLIVLNFFKVIV